MPPTNDDGAPPPTLPPGREGASEEAHSAAFKPLGREIVGVIVGALIALVPASFTIYWQAKTQVRQALLQRRLDVITNQTRLCIEYIAASTDYSSAVLEWSKRKTESDRALRGAAVEHKELLNSTDLAMEKVTAAQRRMDQAEAELEAQRALAAAVFGRRYQVAEYFDLASPSPQPSGATPRPTPSPAPSHPPEYWQMVLGKDRAVGQIGCQAEVAELIRVLDR